MTIPTIDVLKRIHRIKELVEEDKNISSHAIAQELGLSLRSVTRYRKYLDDLRVADLTNEDIANKREELYLELIEATNEIKGLFEFYKMPRVCPICKGVGKITVEKTHKHSSKDVKKTTVKKDKPCELCFGKGVIHFPKDVKRFFDAWMEALQMRAKLYGLDTIKVESLTQLNQFNQYKIPDTVDVQTGKVLANMIKENHENKLKQIE